jgi:glutamate N-acetyltransferase / amino-acid N-acetyltransferase
MQKLITCVMDNLARQIAADGEGARKLIVVHALGFKAEDEARKVARSVANSLLVKTAITGNDPNWGRILAAAGYSGVRFDPSQMDIDLQDVPVCYHGVAARFDEAALKGKLNQPEVRIRVVLNGKGKAEARIFTCDLTEDYIKINASYRT